jgi:eukaryotic-like serine/threonine-protein kinase
VIASWSTVLAMPRRSSAPIVARPAHASPNPPLAARPAERASRPAEIGGFRLVRRLDDDEHVATWVARGADETVILRVFRETASDERIDAETLARERLLGPCAPELSDVATSPAGRPALVVRAVIGPTLDDVLQRLDAPLRAGHLTTLLAPLAALMAAAHETGATLGRLDARGIRIDPAGRPVVVALGRAGVGAPLPARFRSQEPRIVADRAQLDELARTLATRVDAHERASVEQALATGAGHPELLELALFDCAAPLPIADLVATTGGVRSEPGRDDDRAVRVTERFRQSAPLDAVSGPKAAEPAAPGGLDELGHRLGLPSGLLAPLDQALQRGLAALLRLRSAGRVVRSGGQSLGRPRRPVVVIGALGLLCLGAAITIVGAERPAAHEAPAASDPRDGASVAPVAPAAPGGGVALEGDAAGPHAADLPESLSDPTADEWAPLVSVLVDRWLGCAAAPDPVCAEQVAQTGSAASDALLGPHSARADAQEVLVSWAAGSRASVVIDRHGGAVVVDLVDGETTTASLLLLRSEAGWRVRAVLSSGEG